MRQLLRDARAAFDLFRLIRVLERDKDEVRGGALELMVEPQWSLDARAEMAELRGQPPPERQKGWQVIWFSKEGVPGRVGRGRSCGEAVRAALAAQAKPMPLPMA